MQHLLLLLPRLRWRLLMPRRLLHLRQQELHLCCAAAAQALADCCFGPHLRHLCLARLVQDLVTLPLLLLLLQGVGAAPSLRVALQGMRGAEGGR